MHPHLHPIILKVYRITCSNSHKSIEIPDRFHYNDLVCIAGLACIVWQPYYRPCRQELPLPAVVHHFSFVLENNSITITLSLQEIVYI